MKYKTVLIDLDDTLVVEEQSANRSFLEAAKYLKQFHDVNENDFILSVKNSARELWYTLPTIKYAQQIGIASREALWADFTGNNKNQEQLRRYKEFYQTKVWANALLRHNITDDKLPSELSFVFINDRRNRHVLFDDSLEFLKRLKENKFNTGLITNGTPDLQWQKIKKSGIENYFNVITISGEIGYRKPRKEIFIHCLKILGSLADDSVMIGNNLGTDIKGANDLGICSFWLNRGKTGNDTEIVSDYEVSSLNEVMEILCG
jgi:HAD superfamily hydrolase (TIGR01549 family)